eukprot:Lankesteria_metandrocarpae@DN1466_c0_g1_i1.p1
MFVDRETDLDDDQARNFHVARVLAAAFLVFSTLTVVRIQQSRYENASRWRPPAHRPFSWEVLPFVTEDGMFTAVYLSKDYNFSPVFYNNRKFDGTSVIATSTHDSTFIAVSSPNGVPANKGNGTDLPQNTFRTVNFLSSKEGRHTVTDAPNQYFPDILAITLDTQLFKKRPLIGCNPHASRTRQQPHESHEEDNETNIKNSTAAMSSSSASSLEGITDDTRFCYVALQTVPHEFCTSLYRKTAALYRAVGLASVQENSTATTTSSTHTEGEKSEINKKKQKRGLLPDNDTLIEFADLADTPALRVERSRNLFAVAGTDIGQIFSAEDIDSNGLGAERKPQLFSKRHGRAADVSWTCSAMNSQNNFTSNAKVDDYEEDLQCIRVITGASLGYLHNTYTVASLSEVMRFKDVRRAEPYIWSDALSSVNPAAVESLVASVISDQSDPLVSGEEEQKARNQLDDPATGLHFCGKPFRHLLALDSVRGRVFFIQPLRALRQYRIPLKMTADNRPPQHRILKEAALDNLGGASEFSEERHEVETGNKTDDSATLEDTDEFTYEFLDEYAGRGTNKTQSSSSRRNGKGKAAVEDNFPDSREIPKHWLEALKEARSEIIMTVEELKREVEGEIEQQGEYDNDYVEPPAPDRKREQPKQEPTDYSKGLKNRGESNQSNSEGAVDTSSSQRKLSADPQSVVPGLRKDGPQFESSVSDVVSGVPLSPETGMPVAGGVQSLLQPSSGSLQRDSTRLNFCVSQYVFDHYYADVTPCIPIPVAADKEVDIRAPLHMHYDAATNALVFFEFDNHQGGLLLTVMNVDPMSLRFSLRLESLQSGWLLSSAEVSEGTVLILGNMVPYWGIMHIVELQRGRDRRVDVSRFAMNKYEVQ